MPVTYPIDFPTNIGLSSFRMGLRTAVPRSESPYSFVEQVVKFSGEIWEIECGLPRIFRDDAAAFDAFLLKLRGRWGTFLIGDPNGYNPRGSWAGTSLVNGGGQTGDTLNLKGFTPSQTNVAREGDYLQLGTGSNSRLHKVVANANSDGSGNASLLIAPNIRTSPANNATIITTGARGKFRLAENLNGFGIDVESTYQISFKAIEAL